MIKFLEYILLFLIGYQAYFLIYVFAVPTPDTPIYITSSLIGILLFINIYFKREIVYTYKHVTMAATAGGLSFTNLILLFFTS